MPKEYPILFEWPLTSNFNPIFILKEEEQLIEIPLILINAIILSGVIISTRSGMPNWRHHWMSIADELLLQSPF